LAIPDAIIGKLAELGLGDELVHVFNSLMGAVRGFVLMELAPRAETGPDGRDVVEAELRGIDPERFPHLSAHFGEMGDKALSVRWSDAADSPLDESFEYLMRLLLDGIEARVKKTRKRS
jgi:hypothetical protein